MRQDSPLKNYNKNRLYFDLVMDDGAVESLQAAEQDFRCEQDEQAPFLLLRSPRYRAKVA